MGMAVFSGVSTLGPADVRVLGSLLEKQRTTPDAYPLSLNALRLACNQSTNRDPVVDYDEPAIRIALHRLERRGPARPAPRPRRRGAEDPPPPAGGPPPPAPGPALAPRVMPRGAPTPG